MAEQLICNQQVDGSTPFTSSSLYGGIPERPKGADCKSVVTDFAGPNPASPTITRNRPLWSVFCYVAKPLASPRHLLCKCSGPHTATEGRRARSSDAGCRYLRLANIQLSKTLVVGFLLCGEAIGFAQALAKWQVRWSAYRNRRSKSSLFRRRLQVSSL